MAVDSSVRLPGTKGPKEGAEAAGGNLLCTTGRRWSTFRGRIFQRTRVLPREYTAER